MKKSLIAVCIVLSILAFGKRLVSSVSSVTAGPAHAAELVRVYVPAVTHGFTRSGSLPDGDLFLLSKPFSMAVTQPTEGAQVFRVNNDTYGGEAEAIGALPFTEPQGFTFSTQNSSVQITSCDESIWDSNFIISSTPGTDGDQVRLFAEIPASSRVIDLAVFTVASGGVVLSEINPDLMLFVNDRYARGPVWARGNHIAFGYSAGMTGQRTGLLTLAWPMGKQSVLQECLRLGAEITRRNAEGSTSIVFTDIVVNRKPMPGDQNNPGLGLLGNLSGGYPTGLPCARDCPFPDVIPEPPTPIPVDELKGIGCQTVCFKSPQYYSLRTNRLPPGVVTVGYSGYTVNHVTSDRNLMALLLRGGSTPLQRLNQEYVTAQLNILNPSGSPNLKVIYAMNTLLKCYGLKFDPVTLGNGIQLTVESRLDDLFVQARLSFKDNRTQDMPVLAGLFDQLNGNSPAPTCNNLWLKP